MQQVVFNARRVVGKGSSIVHPYEMARSRVASDGSPVDDLTQSLSQWTMRLATSRHSHDGSDLDMAQKIAQASNVRK